MRAAFAPAAALTRLCTRWRPQISPALTHHAATALFFFFGLRTLYQSVFAWEGGDELAEVRRSTRARAADCDVSRRACGSGGGAIPGRASARGWPTCHVR